MPLDPTFNLPVLQTSTGVAIFFKLCFPQLLKNAAWFWSRHKYVDVDIATSPLSAIDSSRAAMFTVSPYTSGGGPSSCSTSPR